MPQTWPFGKKSMTQHEVPQQMVDTAAAISVASGTLGWLEATQGYVDLAAGIIAIVTGVFAITFYVKRWKNERTK